jgi:hypothetical protein
MSKKEMYNMITILVVTLILSLTAMLMSGCAYYSVTKTPNEVKITVVSWREMDAPFIDYYRDGDDKAGFRFSADTITGPSLKDLGDAADTILNVLAY